MKQPDGERRRYARWLVDGHVVGRIRGTDTVALLDLSLGGAQIEHATLIRPGALSFLTLESQGQTVTLKCRVVRSTVHRYEIAASGERELIYHTGLRFLDTSEETQRLISAYIESLKGEG